MMEDCLQKGIYEDVPDTRNKIGTENSNVDLPHHTVIRDDKATAKLRVGFGASSHEHGYPWANWAKSNPRPRNHLNEIQTASNCVHVHHHKGFPTAVYC